MGEFVVTLDNCADEPIHIPNLIQPNGFLIALNLTDHLIVQISENASQILTLDADEIINRPLSDVMPKLYHLLKKKIIDSDVSSFFDAVKITIGDQKFTCVPHCYQPGILILEFEYSENTQTLKNNNFIRQLNTAVLSIQRLQSYSELVDFVAKTVRQLTGYDRVMVYKFDHEYNGDVIAEERKPSLNSFLNHKFPATDIPKQARELYLKNWVRIINNVDYVPVSLIPAINTVSGEYLDLSRCFLRSVSPIHIEYLKNMDVNATLTISIVVNNKLWGLIACHHYEPKYLNYEQRMGIEFFGKVLSNSWQMLEINKVRDARERALNIGKILFSAMQVSNDLNETLNMFTSELLEITDSNGLIISFGDHYIPIGKVPDRKFSDELMQWLIDEHGHSTFYTSDLPQQFEKAAAIPETASGILTVGFHSITAGRIIWFRGEYRESIDWGGNPYEKNLVKLADDHFRLSPRKSFEKWTEAVKHKSKDWEPYHLEAAHIFKSNFAEILAWRNAIYKQQKDLLEIEVNAKTEQITELYEQLLVQYKKLEAVAFEQSHIVRGPLSTIMGLLYLLDYETDANEIKHIHGFIKEKTAELDAIILAIINKLD